MLLPRGGEILPEHPDIMSRHERPSEKGRLMSRPPHPSAMDEEATRGVGRMPGPKTQAALYGGMRRSVAPRCYGQWKVPFRAVPPDGERPSPHQETEAGTSARNTTRSYSNIVRSGASRKFCRLTPPAKPGQAIVRRPFGGEVNTLVLNRSWRTLFTFQGTSACRGRAMPRCAVDVETACKDALRLPALWHPPLRRTLMKTNFIVNLNFKKFSLFLNISHGRIQHIVIIDLYEAGKPGLFRPHAS